MFCVHFENIYSLFNWAFEKQTINTQTRKFLFQETSIATMHANKRNNYVSENITSIIVPGAVYILVPLCYDSVHKLTQNLALFFYLEVTEWMQQRPKEGTGMCGHITDILQHVINGLKQKFMQRQHIRALKILTLQASSLLAKHIVSRGRRGGSLDPSPRFSLCENDLRFGMNVNWTSNFHFIQITWHLSCYHGDQGL